MKDEFLALYKKYFDVTGGTKMETFVGMVVVQSGKSIKIHLDNYVKDFVELPNPLKQKYYRSFVAMLQFAATWNVMDPIRHFVLSGCIAVGALLRVGRDSSMGSDLPFDGISV